MITFIRGAKFVLGYFPKEWGETGQEKGAMEAGGMGCRGQKQGWGRLATTRKISGV